MHSSCLCVNNFKPDKWSVHAYYSVIVLIPRLHALVLMKWTVWSRCTAKINEPITAAPAGGAGSSAQQRTAKLQSSSESPPACLHLISVTPAARLSSRRHSLLCTSSFARHHFERSAEKSRCVSAPLKDAGLYGDDHYVPAVGQTEASSGSAATAAAAHRWTRAYYLSWCEWIDSFTHASPWKVVVAHQIIQDIPIFNHNYYLCLIISTVKVKIH